MLEDSYKLAVTFYSLIEQEYLPAIKARDISKVNALLNGKLQESYLLHRDQIDNPDGISGIKNHIAQLSDLSESIRTLVRQFKV
jgi:hypothetical protein